MKMTGAQIILECLAREGVDIVFGIPGGATLPFYDAFRYYPQIRHILVKHEQSAAHAADGYARVTGKVGVCCATSGPGATNLVTGIANAWMDSVPMVAITGQVVTWLVGRDGFQEADITGITLPITKHNWLVLHAEDLAGVVKEAFHIARSGRPGPVLIDVPRDVFHPGGGVRVPGGDGPARASNRRWRATRPDQEGRPAHRRVGEAPDPRRPRRQDIAGL